MKVTPLAISPLTLGTVQLGLQYGIANRTGKPSAETAFEILDAAVAGGVTSFDTASTYGDSEEILGRYFASSRNRLKDPYLVTKFKVDPEATPDPAEIERQIREQAETSLRRLNIAKIPLYMLHIPGDRSPDYGAAVPAALRKLKAEGVIARAGVSVYRASEIDEMLRHDVYGAVQLPMNIFDLRLVKSGSMRRLQDAGVMVFARSVFLQGLFFLPPDRLPERFAVAAPALRRLGDISRKTGVAIAELALAWLRDLPGVASLVLGSETPEQTAQNIALMKCAPLTAEAVLLLAELSLKIPIDAIMAAITGRK